MTVSLYLAPATSGKTAYLVAEARRRARDPGSAPRVVVASRLQVQAWRRRLAEGGGALGVRVSTFDTLYREILDRTGEVVTRLTDPVEFRLLRALLDEAPLTHYGPIRATPGFAQVLRDLIGELKAGGVFPEELLEAVEALGGEPRLTELARLYAAYQDRLRKEGWADYAGIGWVAAETLSRTAPRALRWPSVMIDGFDDLTTVQLRVITHLRKHTDDLIITLTGTPDPSTRPLVHKRFNRTREQLEAALEVQAEPLPSPDQPAGQGPAMAHLERSLFAADAPQHPGDDAVTLLAVPDREGEVRAALRWLKARIVYEGMEPHEVALLYRDVEPYRAFIDQTAAEFGLPTRPVHGLPLRRNPAVAALLDLLRTGLPGEEHLPWRPTVNAWRSPYFDWEHAATTDGGAQPVGITPQDAEALDWVARWGSVIGGMAQWHQALDLLSEIRLPTEAFDEEAADVPEVLPTGAEAEALRGTFRRFVERIRPPEGNHSCREFVAWLEELIGETEPLEPDAGPEAGPVADVGVARRAADGPAGLVERDLAALNALKDLLRGLVWAQEAVGCQPVTFEAFLEDLVGAVDAASYRLPLAPDEEAVLVANVAEARGLAFGAVAILGLAEGEFPRTVSEDPFLRDDDRARLRDEHDLAIDLSTDSAEAEYFYEAVTRPRSSLLLTRPRIADNGAPWQPSPYWEEVRRLIDARPRRLTSRSQPAPNEAASWTELLQTLSASGRDGGAWSWAAQRRPTLCAAIERAEGILLQRLGTEESDAGAFDGDLSGWEGVFFDRFGPDHVWSASRLETYRTCPFFFFVSRVLDLEAREPPAEGLDGRQLGNIYHHIFEELYRRVGRDPSLSALLEALPGTAGEILDSAPRDEGFRATAWWEQTRREIVEKVARSLEALESMDASFSFFQAEQTFGIGGEPGAPLLVEDDEIDDRFLLRGFIDRVDRARGADGDPAVRVIDYKTAGPYKFTARAIREGKKLQLPLYALAAERALRLGDVVDGFYWHVQQAQPSPFSLAQFGPEAAMTAAIQYAWEAIHGARGGHFRPEAPDRGCPGYCPAAAFCWRYTRKRWG